MASTLKNLHFKAEMYKAKQKNKKKNNTESERIYPIDHTFDKNAKVDVTRKQGLKWL